MYYIANGLNWKGVGALVAALLFIQNCGATLIQSNTISQVAQEAFHIPVLAAGIALAVLMSLIISGGFKRLVQVAQNVAPFMAGLYLLGGLLVLLVHAGEIPAMFASIFKGAFTLKAGSGALAGLGLLPVSTVFRREKTRARTAGTFPAGEEFYAPLSGAPYEGYEIHMGVSGGLFALSGRVLGTYLHGLFDSPPLLQALVSLLLREKGLEGESSGPEPEDLETYKDRQYDRLAAALRASLDMEAVYRILERGL